MQICLQFAFLNSAFLSPYEQFAFLNSAFFRLFEESVKIIKIKRNQ